MVAMRRGLELNDRACRRENLSEEERAELVSWYAEMDTGEAAMLDHGPTESPTNAELRTQIRHCRQELQGAQEAIGRIEERNEALRQQNEALERHLVARGILTE